MGGVGSVWMCGCVKSVDVGCGVWDVGCEVWVWGVGFRSKSVCFVVWVYAGALNLTPQ